jgi:hypothetical protein
MVKKAGVLVMVTTFAFVFIIIYTNLKPNKLSKDKVRESLRDEFEQFINDTNSRIKWKCLKMMLKNSTIEMNPIEIIMFKIVNIKYDDDTNLTVYDGDDILA